MTVSLILPIKAFSVNQVACRDARFKTSDYKDWASKVLYMLSKHEQLKELSELHAERGGVFEVELVAVFPEAVFYNKAGQVSSKTIDCSNFEKPLIDLVFGDTMGTNDKYITKLVSSKVSGADYAIKVAITLVA